ncbi:rRNA pseudouridine synthase [Ornithinimicrobium ciconiae]|uniref:Pseudouridine synthase n=1 Tax=Ornithinimicrobium ciconiae TaxID=2594265 RepID=A0A516GAZ0_9MICO|nr:pseudouridine synthase [Ornithinimicrobium ciconiae]QDO88675.1 rRNA pseudouridine synthase [Ornithinimicrobium ciconiae]
MTPPQQRGGSSGRSGGSGAGRGGSGRSGGQGGSGRSGGQGGSGRSGGQGGSGRSGGQGGSGRSGGGPAGRGRHKHRGGTGRPVGPNAGPARSFKPKRASAVGPVQSSDVDVHKPDGIRLQKLLASAGIGSRRACELLITQGRVEVDGQIVTELGVRVDPVSQTIHVDGSRVVLDESRVYLAFNKPLGVVSTMSDELGRPSISDFLPPRNERLFHVGRLDADTEGLLLLTNDGELSHRLQHPAYEVPKTYIARVPGPVPRELGKILRAGVELEDGVVKVDSFKLIDSAPGKAIIELILHEGKKHVVRRLLAEVGHPVEALSRVQVGPILLGQLRTGRTRALNSEEVAGLYRAAGL